MVYSQKLFKLLGSLLSLGFYISCLLLWARPAAGQQARRNSPRALLNRKHHERPEPRRKEGSPLGGRTGGRAGAVTPRLAQPGALTEAGPSRQPAGQCDGAGGGRAATGGARDAALAASSAGTGRPATATAGTGHQASWASDWPGHDGADKTGGRSRSGRVPIRHARPLPPPSHAPGEAGRADCLPGHQERQNGEGVRAGVGRAATGKPGRTRSPWSAVRLSAARVGATARPSL